MADNYQLTLGDSPLLISLPHAGTQVPEEIRSSFTPQAAQLEDTDWYVDQLYAFASDMGVSILCAKWSRYVIDLNRPPDNQALYQTTTTGLVPTETFAGDPIYSEPDYPLQTAERVRQYWQPYHQALRETLDSIKEQHGHVVLLDGHSIRQQVPRLFNGVLPDLNLGSNHGVSADTALIKSAEQALTASDSYSYILDGRFVGGYITRHYGQPDAGFHALQLEMAQAVYMQEVPPVYDREKVAAVQPVLENLVQNLNDWTP